MTTPTPEAIFDMMTAYQQTAALRAAIEHGLFTAVGKDIREPTALAEHCGVSVRGIRALADYLVVCGLLEKDGGRYGLTEASGLYLDEQSPTYLGAAVTFLDSDTLRGCFDAVGDAVRRGGSAATEEGTTSAENPVWIEFARAMAPVMRPAAVTMAERLTANGAPIERILDVAAGHGLYGIEVAKRSSNARLVGLDWPLVLEVACENARAEGLADRYSTLPGDAFEVDWGEDFDLVLLTNILHHFDEDGCVDLLARAHAALRDGGRIAVLEIAPEEDRVTPPRAASFALVMLATTPSGSAYTIEEYRAMFARAGFASLEFETLFGTDQTIIVAEK